VGAGSCNFPTGSWKFPTEEIMGAEKVSFSPKFPQNGFSAQNFIFVEDDFFRREIFFRQAKI